MTTDPDASARLSSASIGDIGMVKGNVDFSTHIGSQINVGSGAMVQIEGVPQKTALLDLLARGQSALNTHNYSLALNVLKQATELYPDIAQGWYLLALALLKGRRPKVLALDELRAAEGALLTAISLESSRAHYYYALALLRDDFYRCNGMRMPAPSPVELVSQAETAQMDRSEIKFTLDHIPVAPSPVLDYIERRCV